MNVFGPRIRIRPTRQQDLPFLQALWNDGTVMRYKGYPNGMQVTESCMERWWATTPQSQASHLALSSHAISHHLIELLDGTPIGEFSYTIDVHKRALVDLKLAPQYWNHHYALEALTMALHDLFSTAFVTKVLAEPSQEHVAARHLYQRCGFQHQPSENHPDRWECMRVDFTDHKKAYLAEVA